MGRVYQMQGRYREAEDLYKRALASLETLRGVPRLDLARTLDSLEECPPSFGNYDDAEEFFNRALAIKEKALGASHREVALTLASLADIRYQQGKYAQGVDDL